MDTQFNAPPGQTNRRFVAVMAALLVSVAAVGAWAVASDPGCGYTSAGAKPLCQNIVRD